MTLDQARWHIWPEIPRARISPNIYGHFAEHLGRCIYEGIWVGTDSKIPNEDGFRRDTLLALRDLPVPVIRWPGGCFADDYHWDDAVGTPSKRRRWRNIWWHTEEPNEFGTDEFIEFCRRIGAQPYITVNVGSGSPTEASNWVEYCLGTGNLRYAQFRAENGHPEPHDVKYWGIGNEAWGCGGNLSPEGYAGEFRRFATYMKRPYPQIELVAVGHTTPDWNQRFLAALEIDRNPRVLTALDHISIHRYFLPSSDVAFTDDQYYDLALRTLVIEEDIRRTRDVLSYYLGASKKVGIVVDEWGTWYLEARRDAGLEQKNTLQDAVIAGATLNVFNRWADCVTMANIAQTVNVLQAIIQTEEEKSWLTPTYHTFKLFAAHMGNEILQDELATTELQVPQHRVLDAYGRIIRAEGWTMGLPLLSTSASRSPDGKELVLTLVNRHLRETIDCLVQIHGPAKVGTGALGQLAGDDVRAHNSAAEPNRIHRTTRPFVASGNEFTVALPPHSVSALRLPLG